MFPINRIPRDLAAVLTFGRPPLVFGAFAAALWTMIAYNPVAYLLGLAFLILAMGFDWFDGWFADRYIPDSRLGPLVDRMMDRIVYAIIFPVLGAGMFWRLIRLERQGIDLDGTGELLHAMFVLAICVLVLMRDQFAHFLRSFGQDTEHQGEYYEITRLRSLVASPMAVMLYAYAFYLPTGGWEWLYRWLDWLDQVPLRILYVVEIFFLLINTASITLHLRKYGALALDDICEDNDDLRRRILSVLPNALTLMNGFLGIAAIVFASNGRVREALFILVGAAFLDKLDGTLARRLGLTEPLPDQKRKPGVRLGAVLDDLSDGISFCVAPGAILFLVMGSLGAGSWLGIPFWVIGIIYTVAGLGRLVYFILDKSPIPGFFKGMPVPAAALLTVSAVEVAHQLALGGSAQVESVALAAGGVMMLAAMVMNLYVIRYIHFGRWLGRHPVVLWTIAVFVIVLIFTPYFGMAVFAFAFIYLFSPLFTGHIDPSVAASEQKLPRPR